MGAFCMIKGHLNKCENHEQELRLGKGPHAYQLWCKVCNRHTQWLNAKQAVVVDKYTNNKETA